MAPAHPAFPIPTTRARASALPGSDTFTRSAFTYIDDLHRHWGAVFLCQEAVRAFSDTVEISQRHALAEHQARLKEWMDKGALAAGLDMPWDESWQDAAEYVNWENLKIASGLELYLKARLLAAGFLLHVIDARDARYKQLASEQRDRPVAISELLAIQDYQFDGKINFLPGIGTKSLTFSWITDRPAYRGATGLSGATLDIIKDYRELRNAIHLPGEFRQTPAIEAFGKPRIEFLLPFLNNEIIDWTNGVIAAHDLRFRKITHF